MQLQKTNKEHETKLETLVQTLSERSNELETLRKKTNRDVVINSGFYDTLRVTPQSSLSPIHGDVPAVREEITGLK